MPTRHTRRWAPPSSRSSAARGRPGEHWCQHESSQEQTETTTQTESHDESGEAAHDEYGEAPDEADEAAHADGVEEATLLDCPLESPPFIGGLVVTSAVLAVAIWRRPGRGTAAVTIAFSDVAGVSTSPRSSIRRPKERQVCSFSRW